VARSIHSRLHLCGMLVTQSPLHVGGHGEEVDTDLPLTRNGADQLYVPGTSLAGALRELAERLFGRSVIDELWGFQDGDRGHASFVVVDDAVIENGDKVVVEIRDHVGIDREYSCAAEHIKYDRAILPRGVRLPLRLAVEVARQERRDQALAMLAALKQALEAGEVRLGAVKTRGLGHIRLIDGQLTEQVFSHRQGILAMLRQSQGAVVPQADIDATQKKHPTQKRPRLTLTIHWKPIGPLMVKAGCEGIASDMLPLVSRVNGDIALVLPGSSVKGALRSQAERIVRTVRGETAPGWLGGQGRHKFLDAVTLPLINELFGAAKQTTAEPHLGLGALGVRDCYGTSLDQDHWLEIVAASEVRDRNGKVIRRADEELKRILRKSNQTKDWQTAYHVAIDRWLGSAAESMLYTVLEPHRTEWEPLTLEVNLQRLPDALQLLGLALLLLVIRDLANDRLPLGFATHRGMGTVQVTGFQVATHDLVGDLTRLSDIEFVNGRLRNLPDALKSAWNDWARQGVPA